MSIRFWLNANAEKATETKQEKKFGEMQDVSYLGDLEVRDDKGGAKYIDLYADPLDPASSMPTIDRKYVKRVSFVDTYHEGFRTDGIYKLKGATARVSTQRRFHGGLDTEQEEEVYQQISISAGSVKTLREIYSKVRKGELKPDEDWGVSKYELERRERQAAAENESAQTAH
jgi:hypothetical protein